MARTRRTNQPQGVFHPSSSERCLSPPKYKIWHRQIISPPSLCVFARGSRHIGLVRIEREEEEPTKKTVANFSSVGLSRMAYTCRSRTGTRLHKSVIHDNNFVHDDIHCVFYLMRTFKGTLNTLVTPYNKRRHDHNLCVAEQKTARRRGQEKQKKEKYRSGPVLLHATTCATCSFSLVLQQPTSFLEHGTPDTLKNSPPGQCASAPFVLESNRKKQPQRTSLIENHNETKTKLRQTATVTRGCPFPSTARGSSVPKQANVRQPIGRGTLPPRNGPGT